MLDSEYRYHQNLVSIGAGTGHHTYLRGATKFNFPGGNHAVVAVWDSGKSSGVLRVKEGILPPGDYMQCLLGMMEDDGQLREAIIILRDRTGGHPLVNLLAGKSEKAHHGVIGGINALRELFRVRGHIIPVSLTDVDLCMETKNGRRFNHEHEIDELKEGDGFQGKDEAFRIFLEPDCKANPRALQAIAEADKIIFTPGSPYTSIFPHLLVRGIPETIKEAPGKLIAVLNLMTTKGEDHHLTSASDWLRVFQFYLDDQDFIEKHGSSRINYLVVNKNGLKAETLAIYQNMGQRPVEVDEEECRKLAPGMEIIQVGLADYDRYSHLLRHNPDVLAQTVLSL